MSLPTVNLTLIVLSAVIDFAIDTTIFLLFKIKRVTLAVNFFLTFIIPYLSIIMFINSRPSIDQAVPVMGNYIASTLVNLVVFMFSYAISYIIGSVAYVGSGGRTESPEW